MRIKNLLAVGMVWLVSYRFIRVQPEEASVVPSWNVAAGRTTWAFNNAPIAKAFYDSFTPAQRRDFDVRISTESDKPPRLSNSTK
jgi:hypothetical protein